MLKIGTKKESKGKLQELLLHLKYSAIGSLLAVTTFSISMAMQPSINKEEAVEQTAIEDATEEDCRILLPYMDENIIASIAYDSKDIAGILLVYEKLDAGFTEVLDDYFSR